MAGFHQTTRFVIVKKEKTVYHYKMPEELSNPIRSFIHQGSHTEVPQEFRGLDRSITQIYQDSRLNSQQQDHIAIQTILKQEIDKKPELELSKDSHSAREAFLKRFEEKANLINRAKDWINSNKTQLWTMERATIWTELHKTIFPDEDFDNISLRQGDFAKTIELGCAKFISDLEFIKETQSKIVSAPEKFLEKLFSSKLSGPLLHTAKIISHPLGFVCYVHREDFDKIHSDSTVNGSFEHFIPDNPKFSGFIVLLPVDNVEPKNYQPDENSLELEHELKHAAYNHFFKSYSVVGVAEQINLRDDKEISLDKNIHKMNSNLILNLFLDEDKDEAINYHARDNLMFASQDKGDFEAYKIFLGIMKEKFQEAGLSPEKQSELMEIYEKDYENYMNRRNDLIFSIDLLYYKGINELQIPHDIIESMLLILPAERIWQFIKVVLDAPSDDKLRDQIRWYQNIPLRKAHEDFEESQKIYEILRKLDEEGYFDNPSE